MAAVKIYKDRFSNGEFIDGIRYDGSTEIHYKEVEHQPEYRGGMEGLARFMEKNLEYPMDARRSGIEGKVFVQFVVLKDGTVTK